MSRITLWTLALFSIVFLKMTEGDTIARSTVSSGGFLCRVSGKKEVTCLQSTNGGPLVRLVTVTSNFELIPASTQMHIFKGSLFLSRSQKLIVQPLTQGGVKRTITLAHSAYSFIESSTGVAILCRDGNRGEVRWVGFNGQSRGWDFTSEPMGMVGSASLFSDATSNVAMFTSAWNDLYVVYIVSESNGPAVKFIGVWNSVVYTTPAPLLRGCANNAEVVDSPQNGLLLFSCRGQLFAYNYNEANWVDTQGVSNLKIASLFFHPEGRFLAGLLASSSNTKPNQLVFMNFRWQTAFISLRKTSLQEGLFTEKADLFCFTENKMSGLTCYNVSVLLSESGFNSPTMQTYLLPHMQTSLIGSVRDQVVVEYPKADDSGKITYASLPSRSKESTGLEDFSREKLCTELKTALPTLGKLFCSS